MSFARFRYTQMCSGPTVGLHEHMMSLLRQLICPINMLLLVQPFILLEVASLSGSRISFSKGQASVLSRDFQCHSCSGERAILEVCAFMKSLD
jgi:hypothetical protein